MAGLTSAIHFVTLTSDRQTDFAVLEWPSKLYAVELLARVIFLGLSLLCAAIVFLGSGIRAVAGGAARAQAPIGDECPPADERPQLRCSG